MKTVIFVHPNLSLRRINMGARKKEALEEDTLHTTPTHLAIRVLLVLSFQYKSQGQNF